MHMKLLMFAITFISAINTVHCSEIEQIFPSDVSKFIEDRKPCDHFRSEPRDFDENVIREGGEAALQEQAERAEFLEKMTDETCHQMNERLLSLNKKYGPNMAVAKKLAEYEYLNIGSGYFHIHKDFPNAKLILDKLIAKGFMSFDVQLMEGVDWRGLNWGYPLPARLTIQIGSDVDVFPAQLAIETLLDYGPKDIGVVILPDENMGLALSMLVGFNPIGNNYVYTGRSIQNLLVPGISKEAFSKFAKFSKLNGVCTKELTSCINGKFGCVSVGVPDGINTCDIHCQAKVFEKLNAAGISVLSTHPSIKTEIGCVGYRKDLGGTEDGAKCIAKILGYEFHSWGCNADGWPYNVRVR